MIGTDLWFLHAKNYWYPFWICILFLEKRNKDRCSYIRADHSFRLKIGIYGKYVIICISFFLKLRVMYHSEYNNAVIFIYLFFVNGRRAHGKMKRIMNVLHLTHIWRNNWIYYLNLLSLNEQTLYYCKLKLSDKTLGFSRISKRIT